MPDAPGMEPALPSQPQPADEAPAPEEAAAAGPVAEFHEGLCRLTPRVYLAPALMALNIAVYGIMVAAGVDAFDPSVESLLACGAGFGPKTLGGQWWRLFTATFVHIGLVHLLLNMWALKNVGPFVERLYGNRGFAVLYVLAGLGGSLASTAWNPWVVAAGASGAIFGVCGALLGFLAVRGRCVPAQALASLWKSTLVFVAYNVGYGLMHAGIDNAAHLGGLATGFLVGLLLAHPLTREARAGSRRRSLAVALAGGALLVLGAAAIPRRAAGLQRELDRFAEEESAVIEIYNDAIAKGQDERMTDAQVADLLEREVVPRWKAMRGRLEALGEMPASLRKHVGLLRKYARLREESAAMFAAGLRANDESLVGKAMFRQEQAERLLGE